MSSSKEEKTLEELIDALDPEVQAAIDDVDRSLIQLSLQLSPMERVRVAARMARTLEDLHEKFREARDLLCPGN